MQSLTPLLLEGSASLNPLDFDASAFMLTLIVFLVLLALLMKFAWNPILDALDAREKRIEDSVKAAEDAKEEAAKMLADYKAKLADAEKQVAQRVEEGRAMAQRQADEIVEKAREEATRERDAATRDIDAARTQALSDIRSEVVRLSKGIAEQVLLREVSGEDHQRLADEVLGAMK
ncbi:MAG: F0F1 ATP synthase subunit B [Planctomycetota bacterium JB042]